MYYRVLVMRNSDNFLNPTEPAADNWVEIYNDDGSLIKAESVATDRPILFEDDRPEDIANALEKASDEDNIKDMVQFLRKHSKDLLKGKLRKDIEIIEEKINRLEKKKEKLRKQYEEILADNEEGNGQKVREDGIE